MTHRISITDNTQNGRILRSLVMQRGTWLPMPLLAASGSGKANGFCMVHSRISDLREDLYQIEHRQERVDGQVHSYYRLLPEGQQELFQRKSA